LAGRVSDALVEQRDIMPTLLECAGLRAPDSVEGRSFLSHARTDTAASLRPWLHGEHTLFGESWQWLTDGGEKYVWLSGAGREQLFDLRADPQEQHDLATSGTAAVQARLARWRARLVEELRGREEGYVSAAGELVPGREPKRVLRTALG
jgi:arylsulfatase